MAFPRVNALSFWLLPVGGLTILSGFLAKGGAAAAGCAAAVTTNDSIPRRASCFLHRMAGWGLSAESPNVNRETVRRPRPKVQ
jgi:hypothetical protein